MESIFEFSRYISDKENNERIGLTPSNLRFARMKMNTKECRGKGKVKVKVEPGPTLPGRTERQSIN